MSYNGTTSNQFEISLGIMGNVWAHFQYPWMFQFLECGILPGGVYHKLVDGIIQVPYAQAPHWMEQFLGNIPHWCRALIEGTCQNVWTPPCQISYYLREGGQEEVPRDIPFEIYWVPTSISVCYFQTALINFDFEFTTCSRFPYFSGLLCQGLILHCSVANWRGCTVFSAKERVTSFLNQTEMDAIWFPGSLH